jgi:aerobic-type carbon monoxide dehydrogenase small subunit (CoxS/CutS family)
MSQAGYRSVAQGPYDISISIDGTSIPLPRGRSLLATLLLVNRTGDAADFFCAIGQCQRCVVLVDRQPRVACMTYPKGGETVTTQPGDRRMPPWRR